MASSVGIRALQQNAAAIIRRVARGEAVEVTDHGRPVAQILPRRNSRLADLVEAGLAQPARRHLRDLPPPVAPTVSKTSLGQLLAEQRDDER